MGHTRFKIIISPDGSKVSLAYDERLELEKIGSLSINRATDVRYNNKAGGWEIIALTPVFPSRFLIAGGFSTHSEAIAAEYEYLLEHAEELSNGTFG
jgi:hypothetical protein